MSNRSRRDEDVFDMGRETPEGKAVHDSPGTVGGSSCYTDATDPENIDYGHGTLEECDFGSGHPEPEPTDNYDPALGYPSRFVPAEDIDDAMEELFGEYDHRHDGNAICPSCGGVFITHFRFLLPCRAADIDKDDFVEVCTPEDYFAFREDDGTLVVESPGGEQWEYCSYEPNDRELHAECSRTPNHVIWNCKPLGKKDPITEEFMRSISS